MSPQLNAAETLENDENPPIDSTLDLLRTSPTPENLFLDSSSTPKFSRDLRTPGSETSAKRGQGQRVTEHLWSHKKLKRKTSNGGEERRRGETGGEYIAKSIHRLKALRRASLRRKRRQKQSLKRLKILITECKDRGPQYIERHKSSRRTRMRRYITALRRRTGRWF